MRLLAAMPLLFVLAGIGLSYLRLLPPMAGWAICALAALIGLGVSIFIFFAHIRLGEAQYWSYAILAAMPFIVAVPMVIKDLSYPRINDVSTDAKNPPAFVAALDAPSNIGRNMAYSEQVGLIVRADYPDIQPLVLDASPQVVMHRVERLAESQSGWVITHRDAEKQILEGEATTAVFGFVDDFIIRVSSHGGKARIDMRSKSRDGLVDAGANAKRIREFLNRLERASSK